MKSKKQWTWIVGFNYFNLMDAVLTLIVVTQLGGTELNPLMAWLLNLGPMYFFLTKIGIGALTTGYCIIKNRYKLLQYACFLFAAVVVWNIGVLFLGLS